MESLSQEAGPPYDGGAQSTFWQSYYSNVASRGPALDFSNPRVHVQSIAVCLEAAGEVRGLSCLELGCGFGVLASALDALGATPVTGVDQVEDMIDANRRTRPELDWRLGDATDRVFIDGLPHFDRVFLAEILQYTGMADLVPLIWRHVRPGGRLIGLIPNAACPIVAGAMGRFSGRYHAARVEDIAAMAANLDALAVWAVRGLRFAADQRITPYEVDRWTTEVCGSEPPNRLSFVFLKKE